MGKANKETLQILGGLIGFGIIWSVGILNLIYVNNHPNLDAMSKASMSIMIVPPIGITIVFLLGFFLMEKGRSKP